MMVSRRELTIEFLRQLLSPGSIACRCEGQPGDNHHIPATLQIQRRRSLFAHAIHSAELSFDYGEMRHHQSGLFGVVASFCFLFRLPHYGARLGKFAVIGGCQRSRHLQVGCSLGFALSPFQLLLHSNVVMLQKTDVIALQVREGDIEFFLYGLLVGGFSLVQAPLADHRGEQLLVTRARLRTQLDGLARRFRHHFVLAKFHLVQGEVCVRDEVGRISCNRLTVNPACLDQVPVTKL